MFETRSTARARLHNSARLAFLVAAVALWSVASNGGDWPQFRGPNRDGISDETDLLTRWSEGVPDELWRVPLGSGFSGLSVAGGRIFTMYGDGQDELAVGIDAATGKQLWRVRIDKLWKSRWGDGPRSTPTVDGEVVFALSSTGKLHALSTTDGSTLWFRDLEKDFGASPPQWGVATAPLIEGKLLLLDVGGANGASIVALNKKTGEEVWRSLEDKAGYSAPIAFSVNGVRHVVFLTARNLAAVSPEDGALLWSLPWKTSYDVNAATPVFIAPDRLFVSTGYDVGSALYRVSVAEGKAEVAQLWESREMKNKFSSSIHHEGHLYGFDENTLKCVDATTGKTTWRQRGFGFGSLIYADGHLIVLSDDGQLVLVVAAPDEYRQRGKAQIFKGKTWTMPTLVDGQLYLRDLNELVALDISG